MPPFDLIDPLLKNNNNSNNLKRFRPTNYFTTSSPSNINLISIISFSSSYLIRFDIYKCTVQFIVFNVWTVISFGLCYCASELSLWDLVYVEQI